jgi:phytoene/squalene synthetase
MTPDVLDEPTKTRRGENFPVASLLIAPRHRSVILAYYRFARGADDVADNADAGRQARSARSIRGDADRVERCDPKAIGF